MKIIYARMQGYDWVSTPSDAVARELEKLGHTIYLCESLESFPIERDFDFVWSPYESVTLLGHQISKYLNIPHFSHIEVLPPWRVIKGIDAYNYNLPENHPEILNVDQSALYYMEVGKAWKQALIKTISNHTRLEMHEKLLPGLTDVHYRYPSIDVYSIETAKRMYNPKKEQNVIISVGRLTKIKRYDITVDVINKIKTPNTIWRIIGEGEDVEWVKEHMKNPNVTLQFLGAKWGWARFYEMLKANVSLHTMSGMPPIEAALLGCSSIVMEQQPTKDIPEFDQALKYNFEDALPIFKHTESEKAAEEVDKALTGFNIINEEYKTIEKFFNGTTRVRPSSENAKQIIELAEAYLK